MTYDFPSWWSIEFQNNPKDIIIRWVWNAWNTWKWEATKFIKSLIQYANDNNKNMVVTWVYNPWYWANLWFKNLSKDFKYIVENKDIQKQLLDIYKKTRN